MEFLYKLYENEYFGIGLFIVITILTFLFLIILFFGKKDEKVRKLEETKKLELENENAFKETNESIDSLDIPVIEQPQMENNTETENSLAANESEIFNNPVLEVTNNENTNSNVEEPILKEETMNFKNDFNHELEKNIAMAQEQDQDTINSNIFADENEQIEEEKIDIDNLFQTNIEQPIMEPKEEKKEINSSLEVETPFSSVYMNTDNSMIDKEPKEVNGFELPKKIEMPKLNEEAKKTEEENTIEKVSDFDSLFGNIENETYDVNK